MFLHEDRDLFEDVIMSINICSRKTKKSFRSISFNLLA